MPAKPCLHIGYPKAASKTLQFGLFGPHSQVNIIGKGGDLTDAMRQWVFGIYGHDSMQYDAAHQQRGFDELIRPLLDREQVLVFSWELFTLPSHVDRGLIAQRLRALFGDAKIIFNIRSQLDQLVSLYLFQRARALHSVSLQEFISQNMEVRRGSWIECLDYSKVVRTYAELFGKDNVGIFLLEDLRKDAAAYARSVCAFIGVDEDEGARHLVGVRNNEGRSAAMSAYTRFRKLMLPEVAIGHYVPKTARDGFHNLLNRGGKPKAEIPADAKRELRSFFGKGNRYLADSYGLPLEHNDYPL